MNFALIKQLWENLTKDYLTLVAAGIGFYFLLATFPAIAAIVSVYGLFSDPAEIAQYFQHLSGFVPDHILDVMSKQAQTITVQTNHALSVKLMASILLTIYSSSKGMKALVRGINLAYDQEDRRRMISLNLMSLALTFLMLIYFIISLTVIAGMPVVFQLVELPDYINDKLMGLRWPILFVLAIIGLEILYYLAPARNKAKRAWHWVSWGSLIAACVWLVASGSFSYVVANFYDFNEVYGSLGVGIALLFWFWLSALSILIGAEINATLENYQLKQADAV